MEVGDVVAIDQPVVEVETAKAMVEVPCPYGGVVTARFGEEGSELPVGAPLLTVAVGATDASSSGSDGAAAEEPSGGSGTRSWGTDRRAGRPAPAHPAGAGRSHCCDRDRSSVCTCACARCGFRPRSRAGSGR
ncbi:hypothetical protein SMICM304S_06675 [Streptomyces microflavus]